MKAVRVERGSTIAELKEIEIPQIGPNDVLIKVHSAILAPDVLRLIEAGKLSQAPTTIGHKVAGTIVEVGSAVEGLTVGQRARLDPNLSCRKCKYCTSNRDQMCAECGTMGFFALRSFPAWEEYHAGGLAEFVRAPAQQVDVLPENVSFDVGAKIHDLANAVRVWNTCAVEPGATVAIVAATGAMGTACVKLASYFGAGHLILIGRSIDRLREVTALTSVRCTCIGLDELGEWVATRALGRKVKEAAPEGVDAIIDYSPEGVDLWQTLDGLSVGGTLVPVGGNWSTLPVPARLLSLNCWRVSGIRNHSRRDSDLVLDLLREERLNVDELVSHEYRLEDIDEALIQLKNRAARSWMLVIHP